MRWEDNVGALWNIRHEHCHGTLIYGETHDILNVMGHGPSKLHLARKIKSPHHIWWKCHVLSLKKKFPRLLASSLHCTFSWPDKSLCMVPLNILINFKVICLPSITVGRFIKNLYIITIDRSTMQLSVCILDIEMQFRQH